MLEAGESDLGEHLWTPILIAAARDLTLEAAQSAGSASRSFRRDAGRNVSAALIKKLLDSRNDRDILEGLRKVISVCALRSCTTNVALIRQLLDDVPLAAMPSLLFFSGKERCQPEY
jgi:hypothetical protein